MKASIPKSKRPLPKGRQIGLRIKPQGKFAYERLPFVGKDHSSRHSFWDVPLTGGFHGGCAVGKSIAHAYLKYVRDERANPCRLSATLLGSMLVDLDGKQPTTEDEESSKSGQRAGFIGELSAWIDAAATQLGGSLDRVPEQHLVDCANHCLTRTDAALMAAIEKQETAQ